MEYNTRTYFAEKEQDDVKGFTIINTNPNEGTYHIAEKWQREGDEDTWLDYHINEAQLLRRVRDDMCEAKAHLTDEQYEAVCGEVGWGEYTKGVGATA
jgi:putative SOS response-associated peptidase YedK